jgi:hypothetical protein
VLEDWNVVGVGYCVVDFLDAGFRQMRFDDGAVSKRCLVSSCEIIGVMSLAIINGSEEKEGKGDHL